jgi:hypothetical protein
MQHCGSRRIWPNFFGFEAVNPRIRSRTIALEPDSHSLAKRHACPDPLNRPEDDVVLLITRRAKRDRRRQAGT